MNVTKRNGYRLTGSIHTITIKVPEIVTRLETDREAVKITKHDILTGHTYIFVNVNKLLGGNRLRYSDFIEALETILSVEGIKEFQFVRTDFRLDSKEPEFYELYTKLHKYLLKALAVSHKIENRYRVVDDDDSSQLTHAIKNSYIEAENYDRERKNLLTGNTQETAKARLEIRTCNKYWQILNNGADWSRTGAYDRLQKEFLANWCCRLDKISENLDTVQEGANKKLLAYYYKHKDDRQVQWTNTHEFLRQHQNAVYTSGQCTKLLDSIGLKEPEQITKRFKRYSHPEFFSKADVQMAIATVKAEIQRFFES